MANYYGILPAPVRYADVSSFSKLIYCEIMATLVPGGYSIATKEYLAEALNIKVAHAEGELSILEGAGLIRILTKDGQRKIYPTHL